MKSKLKALFQKLPKRQSERLQGFLWQLRSFLIYIAAPFLRFLVPIIGGKVCFAKWPKGVAPLNAAEVKIHDTGIALTHVEVCAKTFGELRLESFADRPEIASTIELYELFDAWVDGATVAVMDKQKRMLTELSPYAKCSPVSRPWDHPVFFQFGSVDEQRIDGTCVLLAGPNGGVYFHWLLELLPRILLLQDQGLLTGKFRCLLSGDSPFVRSSLQQLGLVEDQVVLLEKGKRYQVERLLSTSFLHPQESSAALAPLLQRLFLSKLHLDRSTEGKLIYISRKDAGLRVVEHEERFLEIVQKLGGKVVVLDGMSIEDQAQVFHQAEAVVAPHGSALANLVFCKQGTRVLELFSPAYVRLLYPRIGTSVGLDYWYLIGKGERERPGRPQLYASIDISPEDFEATVMAMLA